MSKILNEVDARTNLAGTNKLEVLIFSIGKNVRTQREEIFGINVFKVREVMKCPPITAVPESPKSVLGMISLRGNLVPIVDLSDFLGFPIEATKEILIVTEYNGHTQGFLVESVDKILRIDWSEMKTPPDMLLGGQTNGLLTAVHTLPDGRLLMMLDVEKILSDVSQYDADEKIYESIEKSNKKYNVIIADDSNIARKQVLKLLQVMDLDAKVFKNGLEAWNYLSTNKEGFSTDLLITDIEMPEMDGFVLTKKIRETPELSDLPIIMYSSLSGGSNEQKGRSLGVNVYLNKFDPSKLSEAVLELLTKKDKK